MRMIVSFISVLLVFTCCIAEANTQKKSDKVWLSVVNSWKNTIYVTEGAVIRIPYEIKPNNNINLIMLFGDIVNLEVKYVDQYGSKQYIPGCPTGTYYSTVRISVSPSPWDPKTPYCQVF